MNMEDVYGERIDDGRWPSRFDVLRKTAAGSLHFGEVIPMGWM
jgi:hypothetical protein